MSAVAVLQSNIQMSVVLLGMSTLNTRLRRPGKKVVGCPRSLGVGKNMLVKPMARVSLMVLSF